MFFSRSRLVLTSSDMGDESSKAVEADHAILNSSEFNPDKLVGSRSQVPNNSPASIKNITPILQSSKSEDVIERDEGPSFRTMSERSNLVARSEPISNCARDTSVELLFQSTAFASTKEFLSIPQLSQVDVAQEQILRALNNLSLPPRFLPITPPAGDILHDIPASFKLSTPKRDEETSALNKLSVPRTKLKPHAPEFVPRRQLYDNNVSTTTTLNDMTNLGPQYSDTCQSICTKAPPAPQKQNVFKGRDLPPHLSFRDANHLYRPIPIAPPTVNQQENEDPAPPIIPNFVSPLPSGIESFTPFMEMNIPSAATYAEAANLATRYPEIASEILVQPLSSVIHDSPLQNNYDRIQNMDIPYWHEQKDMSRLTELADAEQLCKTASVVAVHTTDAPNWAAAPLPPAFNQSHILSEEPRRNSRNGRGRNLKQRNQDDRGYERWHSRNCEGQIKDHIDHIGKPTVSEFHQPPPHQQPSFKVSNPTGRQSSERAVIDQKPQEVPDYYVIPSSHVFEFCHEPSVSATSGLTVKEEAVKPLALANMYNVDLADVLRLVEPSGTPETETEGSHGPQKELLPGQSAPLHKIQTRTEEVVDDHFWNTPPDMLPNNSWSKSPLINPSVVSPSSVFVPTYAPLPAAVAPVSVYPRRNISLHAAFANSPSNSLVGNARSTGDRQEPWSRQQASRASTKYSQDLENKAAFTVADKLEGGTKEVFLRHGTHISSKAASPRALTNTNHQAEQPKNGRRGGYGTFTSCGKP